MTQLKTFNTLLVITALLFAATVGARRTSFGSHKSYTPKAPYDGYGKPSKINGKIKTKTTRGYYKPSNGYKFVNPYSRSN